MKGSIARAIYPFILLPLDVYRRVSRYGEDDPDAWAVLVHERAHIRRVRETIPVFGPLVFGIRFLIADRRFMRAEELFAIEEEMRYRRSRGITYDIERKARQFSSNLYRNLMPYSEAKQILRSLWDKTNTE